MFSERTNWSLERNRFTEAVDEARALGARILDLTASNPTRVGLQYEEDAILSALRSEKVLDYDPQAKGLLSSREAVARYYLDIWTRGQRDVSSSVSAKTARADSDGIDPERIVLTTSTSEGYAYVFRLLCNAGDEVLVPKPSYPLFEFLADLQDVKLVPYPLIYDHGWQMDFPSIEKAVTRRTRAIVLVHPNNPTGSYVHAEELGPLNSFCRAHRLALIVDEVFLDYVLDVPDGKPLEVSSSARPDIRGLSPRGQHFSFAANHDVLTFTLSGVSKISALPQMKVAWIVTTGPEPEVEAAMGRLEMIADTYLSMNAPVQWAIPRLLEQRKSIQKQLLKRVQANLDELDRQLAGHQACRRLRIEGGWYAVLRVPATRSDEELAIELVREKSVLVHPGHFYDFPSEGFLVLSLIPKESEFRQGVERLLELVNR
jgi:alanine-synthesizing transaminase